MQTIPRLSPKKKYLKKSVKMLQTNVIQEAEKAQKGEQQKLIENTSEFVGTWKHIKTNSEACEKFLNGLVKPERIPQIFKEGIEIDLFLEIIVFMKNHVDKNVEICAKLLQAFPKIKRFEIVIKSLVSKEKKDVKFLWETVSKAPGIDKTIVTEMSAFYSTL